MMLIGTCPCGAVEYQVADRFRYAMNCHCSKCLRNTGAACMPIAGNAGRWLVRMEKRQIGQGR